MLSNIPGNIAKHPGECCQTFWKISPNIPGNVAQHSEECSRTFRGMLSNIPGNVLFTLMVENWLKLHPQRLSSSIIVDCLLCHLLCQKFSKVTCCQTQQRREFNLYVLKSSEKFLLVSATRDSVSNHRRAIIFFFLWGPEAPLVLLI